MRMYRSYHDQPALTFAETGTDPGVRLFIPRGVHAPASGLAGRKISSPYQQAIGSSA